MCRPMLALEFGTATHSSSEASDITAEAPIHEPEEGD